MSAERHFVMYADGAARGNPGPAGAGAVLYDREGRVVAELTRHALIDGNAPLEDVADLCVAFCLEGLT